MAANNPSTGKKPGTEEGAPAAPPAAPPAPAPSATSSKSVPVPAPTSQWVPVRVDSTPGANRAPNAPSSSGAADEWLVRGTLRRGNPQLAAVGWALAGIGIGLFALTYFWGYYYGALWAPAGIRGDYLAILLSIIGLGLGVAFLFVPPRRSVGLGANATSADWEHAAHHAHGVVQMSQVLVGAGVGILMVGLLWMAYWTRVAYLEDGVRYTQIGSSSVASHNLGLVLVLVGLMLALYAWAKVTGARRARNLAVAGMLARSTPSATPGTSTKLPSGVTEPEIQSLMKRLDSLMAQLPDAAVTEFSKTAEADTYLKLLG